MVKQSELDEDQIKILMATNHKSSIVAGCAGSGKSVLALIKAQQIQKEIGNNYQVIVYTKALCGFMESGRSHLELKNEFHYHWEWKNKLNMPMTDYVIVDEIQDFNEQEIREFIEATRKHFFFFGDTAQSIYDGFNEKGRTVPVDEIRDLFPRDKRPREWELFRNYRLPLPVAKLVQHVGIDLPPFVETTYKSKEKAMPRILKYDNQARQQEAILRLIKDKTDVAILFQENTSVKAFSEVLNSLKCSHEVKYRIKYSDGSWVEKNTLNFSTTLPKLMTFHSAKGLQFETLIIPCMEQFVANENRDIKALYVAMTRTYKELYILYSGAMPQVLSKIPKPLYKTTEVDEVKDI